MVQFVQFDDLKHVTKMEKKKNQEGGGHFFTAQYIAEKAPAVQYDMTRVLSTSLVWTDIPIICSKDTCSRSQQREGGSVCFTCQICLKKKNQKLFLR